MGNPGYTAQLRVPTRFRPIGEQRAVLPNPDAFGVNKGYWVVHPSDEPSTVEGYPEIILVIEFVHTTLKGAEDHALKAGRMFSSMVSAHGGYPLESPYLHRIASIEGGLICQHNYIYLPKRHMLSVFDQTVKYELQRYLQAISSIDGTTRYRLQSALHWYGVSISASDPTVSYVAAWTGLECIGKTIDRLHHPNGPKAPCQLCGNTAGKDRDRTMAGIVHIFQRLQKAPLPWSLSKESEELIAKDLLPNFSSCRAKKLRHRVVHGLDESIEVLMQECLKFKRHLIYVLLASIQIAILESVEDLSVGSWIPGDYEFRPDARASLKFKGLDRSPYHNEWIEGFSYQTKLGLQKDIDVVLEPCWELNERMISLVESKSLEVFERSVDVFSHSAQAVLTELTTWRERPSEPVWDNEKHRLE